MAKLKYDDVAITQIERLRAEGRTLEEIAKRFGVARSTISQSIAAAKLRRGDEIVRMRQSPKLTIEPVERARLRVERHLDDICRVHGVGKRWPAHSIRESNYVPLISKPCNYAGSLTGSQGAMCAENVEDNR